MRFGPTQIHAENHVGPVLRFGATGAGLNIDKRIVIVHFAAEHSTKFEGGEAPFEAGQVRREFVDGTLVLFFERQDEQLMRIGKRGRQLIKASDDFLQLRALLAQRLGPLRLVPDVRLFQLPLHLGQAFGLALIVKDTPSTHLCARRDR